MRAIIETVFDIFYLVTVLTLSLIHISVWRTSCFCSTGVTPSSATVGLYLSLIHI